MTSITPQTAPKAGGTPWGAIVSLIMGVLYGVSPLDLVSDVIPLVGWVDDAILVPLLLVLSVILWIRKGKQAKAAQSVDVPARRI